MKEDIKYFNKIINYKNKKDLYNNYFCWIYPFTNENIKGYYSKLDFKNKRVLTVTSSGDHALNALLNGAYEVDTFDINPLAKYFSELKVAGIKSLDLEEFLLFFYNKNVFRKKYFMDSSLYFNKIKKQLNGYYREFWDYVFENYSSKDLSKSFLFTSDYLDLKGLLEANEYLNFYDYSKLKKLLYDKKITYYDMNIKDIGNINKKFDLILLSNVPACIDDIFGKDSLKYLKLILDELKKDKTKVVLNYFYHSLIYDDDNEISIYNPAELNKYFSDYEYKSFESSYNLSLSRLSRRMLSNKDKILVSKK